MTIFCTTLYLNRFAYLPGCTLGRISCGAFPAAVTSICTLERPWIRWAPGPGGDPEDSCVPDGEYLLIPHNTQAKPQTFELVNPLLGVYDTKPQDQCWGRDQILIHVANFVHQLQGCIAVGRQFKWTTIPEMVQSRVAMDLVREALKSVGFSRDSPAKLVIQPSRGTLA